MSRTETADFLVEIGTEELPPKALRTLEKAFAAEIERGVADLALPFSALTSFATPRRLAVIVHGLQLEQPVQDVEKRGPPVNVAFDKDGKPTRAALAFAEGCGVSVDALDRQETPKGAWLFHRAKIAGRPAAELLPGVVERALAALPIPRRMRWGAGDAEFVRPVHWVVMLLGESVVTSRLLDVQAGRSTRGHRFHAGGDIELRSPADYEPALEGAFVIPNFEKRRALVESRAVETASAVGGHAVIDTDLLDEVTALVEWPVALAGQFPSEFLRLPEEVLVATLQGHQRYFPVRSADGKLLAHFVTTANIASRDPDQVRRGNERVVLPRLSDAAFFWEQDRRTGLSARADRLGTVVFQQGLGSLLDRSTRVAALARSLAPTVGTDPETVARAASLAKADLLTDMVGEFPELQGRMGYHYALEAGEAEAVAVAIEEQYLPRHAGDRLPSSAAGRVLALAERADTLAGIFALGKRPTGAKDPFGLRRAALGLVRILVEDEVDLDLLELFTEAVALQPVNIEDPKALADELFAFVTERSRAYYLEGVAPGLPAGAVTAEMFEAVRARAPRSLFDFYQRLIGVRAFVKLPEAESLASANKRISNLLRSAAPVSAGVPDATLFASPEEAALDASVTRARTEHERLLARRDYEGALVALASLKAPVDAFFDAVLVMSDDPAIRTNRLTLLQRLRQLFLDVADLSCLSLSTT